MLPRRVLVLLRLLPYYSNATPRTGAAADSTGTIQLRVLLPGISLLLHLLEPYSSSSVAWTGAAALQLATSIQLPGKMLF
jgi:hypothetical protein